MQPRRRRHGHGYFSFFPFVCAGDMVVVVSSKYGRLGKTPRTLDIRPCATHAGAAAGGRRSLGWWVCVRAEYHGRVGLVEPK